MGQDPGFNVNLDRDGYGNTLLHHACKGGNRRSPVIPILLAHPDIDVKVKTDHGSTPFYWACVLGYTSCVRELLKDSRVKVNEPRNDRRTPLWAAAYYRHLDIIKWWIASGREMDLGKPGESKTDAIGVAKKCGWTEVVSLLEEFKENPEETRSKVRMEIGCDEAAAEMFALLVFVSDGLLQVNGTASSPAARLFNIARQLPLEFQMMLCCRLVGLTKEIISGKDSEVAFKELAKRLLCSSIFTG